MNKSKKLILIITLAAGLLLLLPQAIKADALTDQLKSPLANSSLAGIKDVGSIENVVGNIIQVFLSVMGILFLSLMIYGGYKWMMAQGREDEVSKAKDIIKAAITGLGVVLIAYAITYFVVSSFYEAATTA